MEPDVDVGRYGRVELKLATRQLVYWSSDQYKATDTIRRPYEEITARLDGAGFDRHEVIYREDFEKDDSWATYYQDRDLPEEGWLLRREVRLGRAVRLDEDDLFQLGVYCDWLEDEGYEEALALRAYIQFRELCTGKEFESFVVSHNLERFTAWEWGKPIELSRYVLKKWTTLEDGSPLNPFEKAGESVSLWPSLTGGRFA